MKFVLLAMALMAITPRDHMPVVLAALGVGACIALLGRSRFPTFESLTANTDNCFSSDRLSHLGQEGVAPPLVRNSNWCPHSPQRYSNKGIPEV